MSDAPLSERPAATVEDSGPSDPMKPAASDTGKGVRADVRSSDRAPGVEASDAGEAPRNGRADVGSSDRASGMEASGARKVRGNGRADMGNSGAMKLVKIAAAGAALESAAGKTGGDGRGAGVEIGRDADAPGAKATPPWANARRADGRSAGGAVKVAGRDASA